jgi:phosphate transport system permease protein
MKEEKWAALKERIFNIICFLATILPLCFLLWLLADTFVRGFARLNFNFLISLPSRFAYKAGILPGLVGTLLLMFVTIFVAIPLGICAALYLEEYAKDSWLKKFIELNVSNLAGVPSIIYGLLGLELFVRMLNLGPSLLAGGLTLSLLILPVVITSTRESLKNIPSHLREAGLALGASKLSVIRRIVLPLAMSQIITGAILSISRAMGESAPLIVLGAATYLAFVPVNIMGEFSALPLQIFHWVERPQAAFVDNAAAAIIVLLIILAIFNSIAAWLRQHHEKKRGGL